jgi:SAM-dependent methyltransferase
VKDQDRLILSRLLKTVSREAAVLDVGCGIGTTLEFLQSQGFQKIVGVDISPEMVRITRDKDFQAFTTTEFREIPNRFDLLLFSHVLEHLEYREIQSTLEFYFQRLNPGGRMIVLTPLLYDAFYNDVDHCKPYYPWALINLFSDRTIARQYSSPYRLRLSDIHFRTASLQPFHSRGRYLTDPPSARAFQISALFFRALQVLSGNLLSKKTGYGALFAVEPLTREPTGEPLP